jgi:hypothetical protein
MDNVRLEMFLIVILLENVLWKRWGGGAPGPGRERKGDKWRGCGFGVLENLWVI